MGYTQHTHTKAALILQFSKFIYLSVALIFLFRYSGESETHAWYNSTYIEENAQLNKVYSYKERTELEFTVISQRIEADVQRIEWLA